MLFSTGGSAGAWSVLRILFGMDYLLVVLGAPENSGWNLGDSRLFVLAQHALRFVATYRFIFFFCAGDSV